jgi:hypothetical protein
MRQLARLRHGQALHRHPLAAVWARSQWDRRVIARGQDLRRWASVLSSLVVAHALLRAAPCAEPIQ